MKTYLILDFQISDLTSFMEYVEQIPTYIQKHGGRYVVEGLKPEVIEGDWAPETLVILEFPSDKNAREFLADPLVQPIFSIRHKSTTGNLILVQGGSWREAPGRNE